jgi:hypothetical protein
MAENKYAKYVVPLKEGFGRPSHVGRVAHSFWFDKSFHEDCPTFVSTYLFYSAGAALAWGETNVGDFPGAFGRDTWKNLPSGKEKEDTTLYFYFGTDPHNLVELGGEHEFWIGEGAAAEKYVFDKPTVIIVPPHTVRGPQICRRVDKPYFMVVIGGNSLKNAPSEWNRSELPPGWSYEEELRKLCHK